MIFWWITCNYLLNMWFSMIFRSYVPSPVYGQQRPPVRRWSKPAATKQPGEVINVVNPCKPSNRPLVLLLGLPDYVEFSVLSSSFPYIPIFSDGLPKVTGSNFGHFLVPWDPALTWTTGVRQEFATLVLALHLAVLRQLALDLQNVQKVSLCREIDIWVFVHGHGHNNSWQNWHNMT